MQCLGTFATFHRCVTAVETTGRVLRDIRKLRRQERGQDIDKDDDAGELQKAATIDNNIETKTYDVRQCHKTMTPFVDIKCF